jgi:hypothetical protein
MGFLLDFLFSLDHDDCIMDDTRQRKWPRYIVYSLIVIVFLIIILILFLYLIKSPLIFKSGAQSISTSSVTEITAPSLSLDNSYVFASPLRAKIGGEKIRITVFVLDNRGIGILGKKVVVGGGNVLNVTPIQPITDGVGRATFDIYSEVNPGTFIIQASADGTQLIQKATISFD